MLSGRTNNSPLREGIIYQSCWTDGADELSDLAAWAQGHGQGGAKGNDLGQAKAKTRAKPRDSHCHGPAKGQAQSESSGQVS